MSAESRLRELGLVLPAAPKPMGAYRPIVIVGQMAYLSGHGPLQPDGTLMRGRIGEDRTVEDGYAAARQTGLALLATLRDELGDLDRVQRIVKLLGMVNCVPSFYDQPSVVNGCSELFREVFGETAGIAARSAVGVASLPAGMLVEIEAIVQLTASAEQ